MRRFVNSGYCRTGYDITSFLNNLLTREKVYEIVSYKLMHESNVVLREIADDPDSEYHPITVIAEVTFPT